MALRTMAPPDGSAGAICLSNISCISCGTPGRTKTRAPPRRAAMPGAVPQRLSMASAPTGTSACERLEGFIFRPRVAKKPATRSTWRASSASSAPMARASP